MLSEEFGTVAIGLALAMSTKTGRETDLQSPKWKLVTDLVWTWEKRRHFRRVGY
jgi:hypothetical protein